MKLRRRWVRVTVRCATVVILFAGAGFSVWRWWIPEYRPDLRPGERYGIDVSHHQGLIDWKHVASDDVSVAYIKATEGGDWVDDRFVENATAASAEGLDVGAYHFFTFCRGGQDQAANFIRAVSPLRLPLPAAIDLEFADNCASRLKRGALLREVESFIRLVEASTRRRVILYVSDDFDERYQVRSHFDRRIWQLKYLRRPDNERWVIWQVGGFAHIDGIQGGVDLNVVRPEVSE